MHNLRHSYTSYVPLATVLLVLLMLTSYLFLGSVQAAEPGISAISVTTNADGDETYTLSIQVLLWMTAFSFLPAAFMMMTSFLRIIIVLAILRQAIGLASTPSNMILIGLALFLTFFVMTPVFDKAYVEAGEPYLAGSMNFQTAINKAGEPFREFMLAQTRDDDLAMFAKISGTEAMETPDDVPYSLLIPSFITSELKTAFQIGFLIFLPFLIIDLVVASILMAMGMMMLSPMMISIPFKVMLFVLIDGWTLIMGTLASSFYMTV